MSTAANATATLDLARRQETRAPQLVAALFFCPAIASILVAGRIYTRFALIKKHFLEDYSIIAALICSVAMSVFMGFTVIHGCGRHIETVSAADFKELLRIGIGTIQFYALTHFFLKLSILLQYYRVTVLVWEKHLCFAFIAVLSSGYLAVLIVQMVRCVPFEALWNTNYPGAKCINSTAFYFASQGWNMGMDLIILTAPLFILRHSSAPLPQKMLFAVSLGLGGAACIISVIRFWTLLPSTTSADPTWDKVPSAYYGIIEPNLGIMCACAVTLRPLFHRVRRSWFPSEPKKQQRPIDRGHDFGRRPVTPDDMALSSFDSETPSSSVDHSGMKKGRKEAV